LNQVASCPGCGKSVYRIPNWNTGKIVLTDREEKIMYSLAGRAMRGFEEHRCEQEGEGK